HTRIDLCEGVLMSSVADTRVEVSLVPGESLQAVLDDAEPGTVLRLAEGTYEGSLSITTPGVRLVGAGAGRTVIVPGPVAPTTIPPSHAAPEGVVSATAGEPVRDGRRD